MSTVFFTVVIPTYQRNDSLSLCLDRLKPGIQSLDSAFYEVIVSDDGVQSTAEELIKTKYPWVKWLQGPRKGPAANRNNGVRYANGDWLVFTDDDCLPQNNLLEVYQSAIKNNPFVRVFEGAIHPTDWKKVKMDLVECPINITGGNFWSANILVERRIFDEIGGFDEAFILAAQEDQQFKLDLEKKTAILFLPSAIVIHPIKKISLGTQLSSIPKKSKNFVLFVQKNEPQKKIGRFMLEQYLFHLTVFVREMKERHIGNAISSLAWLVYGVPLNVFNLLFIRCL